MAKRNRQDEIDAESADMEAQEVAEREEAVRSIAPDLEAGLTRAWELLMSLPNSHDWGHRQSDLDFVESIVNKLIEVRGY